MDEEIKVLGETFEMDKFIDEKRVTLSEGVRSQMELSSYLDNLAGEMVFKVARFVPYKAGHFVRVPATWWDAFKVRWFPAWILNRFSANYVRYQAKAYFPDFDMSVFRSRFGYDGLVAYRFDREEES